MSASIVSRALACSVLSSALMLHGCWTNSRTVRETTRGTPRTIDRPVQADKPYFIETVATEQGVRVRLSPVECSSVIETPVTTRDVTYTKHSIGSTLVLGGVGAALGAGGAALWVDSQDRPKECPEGDMECRTRSQGEAGAIVIWALGALAIGYGVYLAIKPEHRREGAPVESVERSEPSRKPCGAALAGITLALKLPVDGPALEAVTDASGEAFFALPDEVTSRLYRAARGSVLVGRQAVAEVALAEPFKAWQVRAGSKYGPLTYSDLVASSGLFTLESAELEIAVSPRDSQGAFTGAVLDQDAYRFEGVTLTPIGGGTSIAVAVAVDRVDVAMPGARSRDVIVLLDSSGSMRQNDGDRRGRTGGAEAIIHELDGKSEVAMLDFGAGTTPGHSASQILQAFSSDNATLRASLKGISERGGTPMYAAILDSMKLLQTRSGSGTIVVLTDGAAGDSRWHHEVIEQATDQGVTLFTVGLGQSLDFANLRELGLATGGGFAESRDAARLAAAFRGVGIGVAYGRARVFGRGSYETPPPRGHYLVRGSLVTTDANGKSVASPFELNAQL